MTNIKIRDIDPAVVTKIDDLAKQKGMSRNAFLKMYIENLSVLGELKAQEDRFTQLVKTVNDTIKENARELALLKEHIERN